MNMIPIALVDDICQCSLLVLDRPSFNIIHAMVMFRSEDETRVKKYIYRTHNKRDVGSLNWSDIRTFWIHYR